MEERQQLITLGCFTFLLFLFVNWIHQKRHSRNRKNVKSSVKSSKKQTLESLTPGILGSSSPTKLEKNHILMGKSSDVNYREPIDDLFGGYKPNTGGGKR